MRFSRTAALAVLVVLASVPRPDAQGLPFALFERYLEALRVQTGIPGISAVIVQAGRPVWFTGLGRQDVERAIPARDDTLYPIGDLTQTFAAVLLGQCSEAGGLDLSWPVGRWSTTIPESAATLAHVLSHTSSGVPGESYRYDASRYAALTNVIGSCLDEPFRVAVTERILELKGMYDSVPGVDLADPATRERSLFTDAQLQRFTDVLGRRLATPYRVDRSGRATRSEYPRQDVNAATGLVSTAQDLARFDASLDELVRPDLLSIAWRNVTTSAGAPLPSGLGWFVQNYNGEQLVWHFGTTSGAASSLLLKVPRRNLTLILLANSDGLSPATITEGDVTVSLFARLFLRLFLA